jgi:hypothetical protein
MAFDGQGEEGVWDEILERSWRGPGRGMYETRDGA